VNREEATGYVQYAVDHAKMSKKTCSQFLLINLIFFGVAIGFYREISFAIFIGILASCNIAFIIVCRHRWSIPTGFLSIAIQVLIFGIAINCCFYAINKHNMSFIWWDFLIGIAFQIISFILSFFLVRKYVKKYYTKKARRPKITPSVAAGIGYSLGIIIFRSISPSSSIGLTLSNAVVNILGCLLSFGIVLQIYMLFLIKRYDLLLEPKEP